jgi:hypothetical protein
MKEQGIGNRRQGAGGIFLPTNNCTGEAFGELFLAMIDNLSSKCFAPTDNCTGEAFGELFLAMIDNLSSKCFAPTNN